MFKLFYRLLHVSFRECSTYLSYKSRLFALHDSGKKQQSYYLTKSDKIKEYSKEEDLIGHALSEDIFFLME